MATIGVDWQTVFDREKYGNPIQVRLPGSAAQRIGEVAEERGCPVAALMREAILHWLMAQEEPGNRLPPQESSAQLHVQMRPEIIELIRTAIDEMLAGHGVI